MTPIKIQEGRTAQDLVRRFGLKGVFPTSLDEVYVPVVLVADLTEPDNPLGPADPLQNRVIRWARSVTLSAIVGDRLTGALINPVSSSVMLQMEFSAAGPGTVTDSMRCLLMIGSTQDVLDEGLTNLSDLTGVRTNLSGIEPDSATLPFNSVGRLLAGGATTFPLGANLENLLVLNNTGPSPSPFHTRNLILPPGWAAIIQREEVNEPTRFHYIWREYAV